MGLVLDASRHLTSGMAYGLVVGLGTSLAIVTASSAVSSIFTQNPIHPDLIQKKGGSGLLTVFLSSLGDVS